MRAIQGEVAAILVFLITGLFFTTCDVRVTAIPVECRQGFTEAADRTCIECSQNSYKSSSGGTPCHPCPVNSQQSDAIYRRNDVATCLCNAGFTSRETPGELKCVPCPHGTYKSELGDMLCKHCLDPFAISPVRSTTPVSSLEKGKRWLCVWACLSKQDNVSLYCKMFAIPRLL